jgi:hypothetical protein
VRPQNIAPFTVTAVRTLNPTNVMRLVYKYERKDMYRMGQKSVNWLVKYTLKYVINFFITY